MSRHGMVDDWEPDDSSDQWRQICFRGSIKKAIKGKRGQAFLRELIAALDAMPVKKLIAEELEHEGEYCAMGCVGKARGIDMSNLDPYDVEKMSKIFGIAPNMIREIEFINDETVYWSNDEIPEIKRWNVVRQWAESQLIPAT